MDNVRNDGIKHLEALREGRVRGGQVDLSPAQFSAKVEDVSSQENTECNEYTNENSGSLRLSGAICSDDTVFSNDLDAFNVVARRFIGIVDIHFRFAFARHLVDI